MLREQIAPFDVNFVRKEEVLEFSGLRGFGQFQFLEDFACVVYLFPEPDAVTNIMQSRWGIGALASLGYGIMSAAAPSTVESFSDAKQVCRVRNFRRDVDLLSRFLDIQLVDKELKRVCEEFIVETAKGCVDVLSGFLAKVRGVDSYYRLANYDGILAHDEHNRWRHINSKAKHNRMRPCMRRLLLRVVRHLLFAVFLPSEMGNNGRCL